MLQALELRPLTRTSVQHNGHPVLLHRTRLVCRPDGWA
jgi:hypothetical protein